MSQNNRPINQKGISVVSKSKKQAAPIGFGVDQFGLDEKLVEELKEQNLEARFLSIKEIEKGGGYHQQGWRPYKRKTQDFNNSFSFGRDTEGGVRRGDLILGVKTKEEADIHRQYLAQNADRCKVKSGRTKAELQEYLRRQGVDEKFMSVAEDKD